MLRNMDIIDLPVDDKIGRWSLLIPVCLFLSIMGIFGCQQELLQRPRGDLLNPPKFIDSRKEYGHIQTLTISVPAKADIFLAGAATNAVLVHPTGQQDVAPENSPVKVLEDVIVGGETLDIYASGKARHLPIQSIEYGPKGWAVSPPIEAGPTVEYEAIKGPIGALVGLFDNQDKPFIIGQRKQIETPRGAEALYLAMLDYPGASSDNQGEYFVTIYVLRR